ncbi:hypothetical protein C0075_01145 [Rhizobium sp. KAs_5_22]|jgi:hypothetical protein|uniref:hypothetical protein n=1 Tax=Ciceribacter selenitireducens TaxID=448181 RepID=UPI00048E862F|nr:hypothetical protein [Ciceribacter selenitireducens]PPJ49211.1 hypothetical protein C0075_01145 [Rhizobium sp. KAs_5_22]
MIDVLASQPLAKAIGVRRETQRHLDCLTRQIAARVGRQATTVRARRRSGHRLHYQELVDRLAFERWSELDAIARRLAMQLQVIGDFQRRDHERVQHPAK